MRTIIEHPSPLSRRITDEITLYNDTDQPLEYVVLQAYEYRPGMRITDQDGTVLGVFTTEMVRELLKTSDDPEDKKLLEDIDKRRKYIQCITLPKEHPFAPGKMRVIRIEYVDAKEPVSRKNSIKKCLFNIPEFEVKKNTPPTEKYPTKITILAPTGFRVKVEYVEARLLLSGGQRDLDESDHYHKTISGNIIDINVPHVDEGTVQFYLVYGIYLDRNEERLLGTFTASLIIFSIVFLLALSGHLGGPIGQLIRSGSSLLGTVVVLTSLAFIGLTANPLTHRTKYWLVIPIILTIIAFLVAPAP
jgi:hypothetical protein